MVLGALTFTVLLRKESKRYKLNVVHFVIEIVFALLTFGFSNLVSNILYNILLPIIAGVNYLKDGKFSEKGYKTSFDWLAMVNTCFSIFLFLLMFIAILGADS